MLVPGHSQACCEGAFFWLGQTFRRRLYAFSIPQGGVAVTALADLTRCESYMRKVLPAGTKELSRGTASSVGGMWGIPLRSQKRPQHLSPELTHDKSKPDCLKILGILRELWNSWISAGAPAVSKRFFIPVVGRLNELELRVRGGTPDSRFRPTRLGARRPRGEHRGWGGDLRMGLSLGESRNDELRKLENEFCQTTSAQTSFRRTKGTQP